VNIGKEKDGILKQSRIRVRDMVQDDKKIKRIPALNYL